MDHIKEELANADPFKTWWPFIISVMAAVAITIRSYMGGQTCPSTNDIPGKWVIVTGALGGIGQEVCKELASRGANLILGCKCVGAADTFVKYLRQSYPKSQVEVESLDLNSFESVRKFVAVIGQNHSQVDVLINQAGIMFNPYELTGDGYEMHLQSNYLGHFLLTVLLLPLLNRSEQGRIINVSGHAYAKGRMDFEDPLNKRGTARGHHARDAFSHSKLAIVLASQVLSKRLRTSNVAVFSCTPGLVRGTGQFRNSLIMRAFFSKIVVYPWMWMLCKKPMQGAQTIVYLAVEPKLGKETSGCFFNDCERTPICGEFASSETLAEKLFRSSLEAVNVPEIKL